MRIAFIYPWFPRHADSHPELRQWVACNEYLGPPSLGIASIAAVTPPEHEIVFIDDRVTRFDPDVVHADLYALSFFTPAATRGLEIARALRARGKTVVAGGIFPTLMPEVVADAVDALVIGEGDVVWPRLLSDFAAGRLAKTYQATGAADLGALPPPKVELYFDAEGNPRPDDYPLQLSRGCPLECDACALPPQLGKTMRFQSEANLEALLRSFAQHNKLVSLTEDTSIFTGARGRFKRFLELVLRLQAEGVPVRFSYLGISMPMVLHLDPELMRLLAATGLDRFYLVGGFDPITRGAFGPADPRALDRAERAIARCLAHGIDPYVSFLVGNEEDDERVFSRILSFARKAGVGLAEFAIATPYPGTPMWHKMQAEGRIFEARWDRFNDANVVFRPNKMSAETLQEGYLWLWREFYGGRERELEARDDLRRTIQY